jgi:hypothetical protein
MGPLEVLTLAVMVMEYACTGVFDKEPTDRVVLFDPAAGILTIDEPRLAVGALVVLGETETFRAALPWKLFVVPRETVKLPLVPRIARQPGGAVM